MQLKNTTCPDCRSLDIQVRGGGGNPYTFCHSCSGVFRLHRVRDLKVGMQVKLGRTFCTVQGLQAMEDRMTRRIIRVKGGYGQLVRKADTLVAVKEH